MSDDEGLPDDMFSRMKPLQTLNDADPFGLSNEELSRLWDEDLAALSNQGSPKTNSDEDLSRLLNEGDASTRHKDKRPRLSRDRKPGQPPPTGKLVSASGITDPGRSFLCAKCMKTMEHLHEHPWADDGRAPRPFGWTHLTYEKVAHLLEWREILPGECGLCQIVSEAVTDFLAVNKFATELSRYRYLLRPSKYGSVPDLVPKLYFGHEVSDKKVPCARWSLAIELDILNKPRGKVPLVIENAIHGGTRPLALPSYQLPMKQPPYLERGFLHARARAPECDTRLLRSWFDYCESHHGTSCSQKTLQHSSGMRLIDTQDECVKSYLPGAWFRKAMPYVALSYVCGDKSQSYVPKGHSYSSLSRKGALREVCLSRTIADAINLVRQLGLRYLWADALCIDQQNAVDRREQIANMASVYQCATFTIVAAFGNDCNAGLPGMRRDTRSKQRIVEMGNISIVKSHHRGGERLLTDKESKWARRAWCFQEDLLSTRQLIFTGEQVWWRCRCSTWCEGSQLETDDAVSFVPTGQPCSKPLEERFSTLKVDEYFELVGDYARRQLTFASDALNAFAGIISLIASLSGQHFLWGHMTADFERQLYWVGKSKMRCSLDENTAYHPTWSWVGWEGEVSFRHHQTYKPTIICFVVHAEESSFAYKRVSATSFATPQSQAQVLQEEEMKETVPNIAQERYPNPLIRSDFHLFFYTYSATFYLMPYGRLVLPDLATRYAYDENGKVVGPRPDYGYLVPSLDSSELCEQDSRECILLGRKPPSSKWDRSHVVVMLVTRISGIAYRLGIADMAEEFWDLADKTWEMIILG